MEHLCDEGEAFPGCYKVPARAKTFDSGKTSQLMSSYYASQISCNKLEGASTTNVVLD
jgi:hypothetical protein